MADPTSTSALPNLPFTTIRDLQDACRHRTASLRLPYLEAVSWLTAQRPILGILVLWIGIGAWVWVPVIVLVYAVITGTWIPLLGIPVAVLFHRISYPLNRRYGTFLYVVPAFIAFGALLIAANAHRSEVAVIAAAGLMAWLGNSWSNDLAVALMAQAALGDPRMFSQLWMSGAVGVRTSDGATHTVARTTPSSHGLVNDLLQGGTRVNDYFIDAVRVYACTLDPAVRQAALTAGVVADRTQRSTMVAFAQHAAAKFAEKEGVGEIPARLAQLAYEIAAKDWTIADVRTARRILWNTQREYAQALDAFDSAVFRRRFPELFPPEGVK